MPINVKCLIFLYFQYNKNENARTEKQLDIKTLLCIDRDNSSRISRRKIPSPRCKDNQNEKMTRKALPKNSTKDRFPIIPQTLNSHYRDPRRLNNHQNLPNNKATKVDVHNFSREMCICMQLVEGQHTYVRDCQAKTCVYMCENKTRLRRRMKDLDPE
jgi:hypothetical protein